MNYDAQPANDGEVNILTNKLLSRRLLKLRPLTSIMRVLTGIGLPSQKEVALFGLVAAVSLIAAHLLHAQTGTLTESGTTLTSQQNATKTSGSALPKTVKRPMIDRA